MIINIEELRMVLVDLEHAKARLERNKQTGSVYRVDKAIKHLSEVLELFDGIEKYGNCIYSEDAEKALGEKNE